MPEAAQLIGVGRGAVVAPAGHGKTQLIAEAAALGERTLVLTHTHAGVHAIRSRLKRLGVSSGRVSVDTIAAWAARYAAAFPTAGRPPATPPVVTAEWQQVYRGGTAVLQLPAVRRVVAASYERVLIDEYQDCNELQHQLAIALSEVVPTIVFGDPMQGIFEFADARLQWRDEVFPHFPFLFDLEEPHRWKETNPDLGAWIFRVRGQLERGEMIDLASGPATFHTVADAYDMAFLFEGIDQRDGPTAAIHCRRGDCNHIARASGGAYQAIEEIGANRLRQLAIEWDAAANSTDRCEALGSFWKECAFLKDADPMTPLSAEDQQAEANYSHCWGQLAANADAANAKAFLAASRRHPRFRLYRRDLWRDADRAFSDLHSGRCTSLFEAAVAARQRVSASGRATQKRVISTPLLLKGLEYDHVLIPNAAHFQDEQRAQAKLFYVALSRARKTLCIASTSRYLQLPPPT